MIFSRSAALCSTLAMALGLLAGCATQATASRTSGPVAARLNPPQLGIELEPSWPSGVGIDYKVVRGVFDTSPAPPNKVKLEALDSSRKLQGITQRGAKKDQSARFAPYGVQWVGQSDLAYRLKIYIPSVNTQCGSSLYCLTRARVRVDVIKAGESKTVWTYLGDYGQPTQGDPALVDGIFDALMDSVVDSMVKDGVISKK